MKNWWLRIYADMPNDRKMRRLNPAQRWLWITCLCIARTSPIPGKLLLSEGVPVDVTDLADAAAIDIEDVEAGLKAFEAQNMMTLEGDTWCVTNFLKRQYDKESDTPEATRERKKLSREKKKNDTERDTETPSRDLKSDVTRMSRECHATYTETETETESTSPPPARVREELQKIQPQNDLQRELLKSCGVNIRHASTIDVERWPSAVDVLETYSATAAQIHDFARWWFETPPARGPSRKTLYLSNFVSTFPQFIAQQSSAIVEAKSTASAKVNANGQNNGSKPTGVSAHNDAILQEHKQQHRIGF